MRSIGSAGLLGDPQRVDAGLRLEHRIAARGERARGEGAHRLLVLDQQDRAAAGQVGGGLGDLLLGRLVGVVGEVARQQDAERRALAGLAVAEHVAAGLLDDAVDHRQAEAGALADLLGGEERLEDLVLDLGRNAVAGVLDLDQHVVGRNDRHLLQVRRIRRPGSCGCAA